VIERTYDGLDRILSETTAAGTVGYTYDAAGRRTGMTANGLEPTEYTWDDADRLTGVSRGPIAVTVAYDAAGYQTTVGQPGGVGTIYRRDPAEQVTAIDFAGSSGPVGDIAYTRAADGRPTGVSGSLASTLLPDAVPAATYDAAGQLTQWGDQALTYDADGNRVTDGSRALTWDPRGQLVAVTGPVAATYAYDAFGRRVQDTVDGTETGTVFDGLEPLRQTVTGGSTTDMLSGLGLDRPYAKTTDGGTLSFLSDEMGSVIGSVGADGTLVDARSYEPFGRSPGIGPGFTGRPADATGFVDLRARPYDPATGRFLSADAVTHDDVWLASRLEARRMGTLAPGGGMWIQQLDQLPFSDPSAQTSAFAYGDPLSTRDPLGLSLAKPSVVTLWAAWRWNQEVNNYNNGRAPGSDLLHPDQWLPSRLRCPDPGPPITPTSPDWHPHWYQPWTWGMDDNSPVHIKTL